MSLEKVEKVRNFNKFEDVAEHILQEISKQTGIASLFIAKNDGQTNRIVEAINMDEELIREGSIMPLKDFFCNLSIEHGGTVLAIEDISTDERISSLETASCLGKASFVGIPVYYENGEVYGTICGLDRDTFEISEEHLCLFETMSALLAYVLELEKAKKQMQFLSSPLVPVAEKVAILPIIGEVTASRAQSIIDDVLAECERRAMEYLIIDVSGISQINSVVGEYLLKLVNILKIIGITPVITGIQPFMALKVPHFAAALKGILIEANLETALKQLGFVLIQECKEQSGHL